MRTQTKNARFANNPAFNRYVELLLEHERAVVRGDQEAADRIADEACDLNTHFSYEENQWLHGLSGDLKVLSGNHTFFPTSLTTQEIKKAVLLAIQRGDAETALTHLRHASFLNREFLAYFFAQAYEIEGYTALALDFMRCAIQLEPGQEFFICMLLQMLDRAGQIDEAIPLAQESLSRSNATSVLVIASAGTLRMATRMMDDEEARPLLEQATEALKRLLDSQESVARLDPESYYMALWLLASCNDALSNRDEALRLYSVLINLNPTDGDAYAMRGKLLIGIDNTAAIADYGMAVSLNTHALAPYLVLANEALKRGRFKEAHLLSSTVLSFKKINNESKAAALEFLAISSFELGGKERAKATSLFEQAVALDPHNERLQRNFEIVREGLHQDPLTTLGGSILFPESLTSLQMETDVSQLPGVPRSAIAGLDREIQRDMAALV